MTSWKIQAIRENAARERELMAERQAAFLAAVNQSFQTPAARFVLEHGQWFTPAHRPVGVRKRSDKACYRNAGAYVLDHQGCRYVEGFAASDNVPVQHAWASDERGSVIDTTWREPETCLYFGVAFDAVTWASLMANRKVDGLLHDGQIPEDVSRAFKR